MHSTRVDDTRGQRIAYLALIALTVAVGVVTFVLSFYGLRDYGIRVERLSPKLATLVPVGVDILSLCGVAGTYLLRNERVQVRAYAWLVFGTAVALSVAGNITHAVAQQLDSAGMVGAAAWPILLALAAHFVIVTRRALEHSAQPIEPPAAQIRGLLSRDDPEGLCTAQPAPTFAPEFVAQPPTQVGADAAHSNEDAESVGAAQPTPVFAPLRIRPPRPRAKRTAKRRPAKPVPAAKRHLLRDEVEARILAGETDLRALRASLNGQAPSLRSIQKWREELSAAQSAKVPDGED